MSVPSKDFEKLWFDYHAPDEAAAAIHTAYAAGQRSFQGLRLSGVNLGERLGDKGDEGPALADIDFSGSVLIDCGFVGADLRRANFSNSYLTHSAFVRSNLEGANFDGSNLQFCGFGITNMRGVSAQRTYSGGCDFGSADLSSADFRGSHLRGSVFERTRLVGARFSKADLREVTVVDTDLSALCLATIRSSGMTIDWRSVIQSRNTPRQQIKNLLLRSGMPTVVAEYFIDATEATSSSIIKQLMQSTFISYGGPDERFARRLRDELHANGVQTFLFASDAPFGEKLHTVMRDGVNNYDRVILVCSRDSLNRPGVLNEIEETLDREAREGGAVRLLPIRLDDYLFEEWRPSRPGVAATLKARVVGDFRGADKKPKKFQIAVSRLLAVLKKDRGGREHLLGVPL